MKESANGCREWKEEAQDEEIKIRADQSRGTFIECALRVKNAPTIEAEPVRHGRWAKAADKQYCTECRAVTKVRNAPFCWHCGAKIDLRTPTEVALDIADSVMMGGADNG